MMKRIIAIIMVITLVMGNNVSVLAAETADSEQVAAETSDIGQVVSEEEDVKKQEGYELIIEDGVVTDCTGTPVHVVIPEGVTSIGSSAFYNCSSLTSIEIPSGVTNIGSYAFYNCSGLASIEIPRGVTNISDLAFYGCRSLTSIEIPEGVTNIGVYAFFGCWELTSIEIPDSVTSIEEGAFLYCESLTSIEIPDGVTSIEDKVFSSCKKLTSIKIPSGVTSIGDSAFEECDWLRSIEIPSGVTSIGDSAFENSGLTSIKIPSGVTSIGKSVFKNCYSLKSIEIPDGVTSIGDSAFYYCNSLTSIEIPDSVTSIGDSAFYHCYLLTSIEISSGVTSIGNNIFSECSNLSIIKIPDSVTSIGENAFFNCRTGFTICGIADSCAETYAKSNNIPFVSINDIEACVVVFNAVGGTNLSIVAKEVKEGQTLGILPTVERADFIFKGWYTDRYSGTKISEDTVVTNTIMVYAHWEGIIIEDGVVTGYLGNPVNVIIPEGVTEIGERAFYGCGLEDIKLPSTLVSIGINAFVDCSNLKSVSIPESVTSIGINAFADCSNLKSVSIPEGVTELERGTFAGCSSLETVVLPKKLTEIKEEAFADCGLTSVAIPEGVVSIGPGAFAGCKNLADIQIPETVIKFGEGMSSFKDGGRHPFEETKWLENKRKENPFVIVNNILVDAATLKGNVKIPAGVTAIAGYAFSSAEVTNVVIPYGVTKIGSRAFEDCGNLASVKIPSSVNSIIGRQESYEEDSFAWCDKDKLTIYGKTNSYAHTFAINEGIPFAVYEEIAIKNEDVTLTSVNYVYTGDEIQPDVMVNVNTEALSKGTDYTVTYKNNVAAGTAELIIAGQGYYTGTITKTFNIMPASITEAEVTLSATSYTYSGKENKPGVTVKCGDKTLAEGTDYTVSYANNTAVGTATVTITGKGNYTGTINRAFTITEAAATATSIKDAKVTLSKTSYNYDGKAKKPAVTVMLGSKKLGSTDYTVTYKNNKNIGTATVTIKGKGGYTGTLTKTFTIKAKKGATFTSGSYKYKVTSATAVAFTGLKSTKTTKVTIPKTVKYGGKTFKVTSVADKALKGKTKVTQITIGANVTKIGTSAFEGCTKLSKVTMGANVTSIGTSAFKGCTKLTKISIGNKVKTIGVSAFEGCKKLSSVTIGSAVTTIEDKAFKNCTVLKNITIPGKVTKIDKQAFYGCKKLKTITIKSTKLKTVGKEALKGINAKAEIKVPKSKLSAYKKMLKGKGQGSKVKIVKK